MSEKKFVSILCIAAALRVFFDYTLMHVGFWSNFFNFFYLFVLYFSIVSTVHFLSGKFYQIQPDDTRGFFFGYAPYWVLLFPAVPVVSYLTGSSYQIEIPLFSYMPTFMVHKNYLPSGMLFIIPLMFASFVQHASKYLNLSPVKVLLLLMIIFWADYLLLYQWLLQLGYFLQAAFSNQTFLAVYGILMLIWGAPFCYYAYKKAKLSVEWLHVGGFVFYTFFFLLIFKIGTYYLR